MKLCISAKGHEKLSWQASCGWNRERKGRPTSNHVVVYDLNRAFRHINLPVIISRHSMKSLSSCDLWETEKRVHVARALKMQGTASPDSSRRLPLISLDKTPLKPWLSLQRAALRRGCANHRALMQVWSAIWVCWVAPDSAATLPAQTGRTALL